MIERRATFSRDRRYRYTLWRRWGDGVSVLPWVLLNPSNADGRADDPTIRRVVGFSRSWGFDACVVVNLFAWRASTPSGLCDASDPTGPGNRRAIADALVAATEGVVAVAWGGWRAAGVPVSESAAGMLRRIARAGLGAAALGYNRDRTPRHPLYVGGDARLRDYLSS